MEIDSDMENKFMITTGEKRGVGVGRINVGSGIAVFFIFLAALHGLGDLSSPTRDRT